MRKRDVFDQLTTEYSEQMDRDVPWNFYPRTSMVRESFICLNGEWDFAVTSGDAPSEYVEKILVPFPPESALSGVKKDIPTNSTMYYRRSFGLDAPTAGKRALLHFGAVDTYCEVWLNDVCVMRNAGGYLPFSADVTDTLLSENTLVVAVRDPLDGVYPYGKQTETPGGMWYTPVSGIWQTVWLELVPEVHVERIRVRSFCDRAEITVVGGASKKVLTLDSGERIEFEGEGVTIRPEKPRLWTPIDPYLYRFTIECGEDSLRSYFALREISIERHKGIPRLCLNGEPILINGLLDQGYFPDGLFLPATPDGYRDDILRTKEFGFNMLRKHIKIEPEIFYSLCDELGVIVFQDMVNNGSYSFLRDTALPTIGLKRIPDKWLHRNADTRQVFLTQMRSTLAHLEFFPSVLYYTIFNEGWGQFCADDAYELARSLDPTRIYDATSGWFTQSKSDVDSRHVYFKEVKLGKLTDKPIVISEFGGYAHRVDGHLFGKSNYGYRIYSEREKFEQALIALYRDEIMPLIPLGVSALVYTQLTDIEDETNGLITYDRRVTKVDAAKLKALMDELYRKI